MKKTKALVHRLIEEIEKHGIIQSACDKYQISRQTFYRWMKEDKEFLERVNEALSLGVGVVNDIAISNVLTGIKNKDVIYTKYWLSHRHADFRRPFVHRVDSDLLAHFRALAEGSRTAQIRNEISDFAESSEQEIMELAKADAKEFFERFGVGISKKKPPKAT